MKRFLFVLLILLMVVLSASAQNYQIKKYVFGSSAQTASNNNYIFNNTVGQPVIGVSSNQGSFVYHGFWYGVGAKKITQKITLELGWNLISMNVIPDDLTMETIWAAIVDKLVIVKNSKGSVYIPSFNINTIGSWNILEGYQAYMSQKTELSVEGFPVVPEDTPIALSSGWSWVGYLKQKSMNIKDAVKTLTDDNALVIAKNLKGEVYIPQFDVNTIGNMLPSVGYQVYLSKASTLTYPSDALGKSSIPDLFPLAKYSAPEYNNTANTMSVVVHIPGIGSGYEINAVNKQNQIIGSGGIRSGLAYLTIWGDDEQTNFIDGITDDEEFSLKLFNIKENISEDLLIRDIKNITRESNLRSLVYKQNAVINASVSTIGDLSNIDIKVNPNPVVNNAVIEIDLLKNSNLNIDIYSVDGKFIKNIVNNKFEKGISKIELNTAGLTNGEYNLIADCNGNALSRKIVILR